MKISKTYVEQLLDGLPTTSVTMYKYPPNGLSLSDPDHRREISDIDKKNCIVYRYVNRLC